MSAAILFLILIVLVGVLITVDVLRTPVDTPTRSSDRPLRDAERPLAAGRATAEAHAAPVQVGSFERPDAPRGFDPVRRDVPSAPSDAQRGKLNTMFGDLSRRSQALVERQLRLIESLEHGEQDQQRLASLARLNRIAMHMHRNSQNLLVLVGQEPATSWNQPVSLAQLVEVALSEIEDYERVYFEVQPDIAVRGPAVYDAVHLLVELIDNATAFSAADMPVQIRGQVLTSGGALIDITDRGIGMAAREMAYANQQLDNPPPPDLDVPKWMGLLVVARLAARHGIRVRLNQAEFGGLTALVWLPDEILTHYGAVDPGYPSAQRGPTAGSAAYATAHMPTQDMTPTRAEPVWAGRGPQAAAQAEPSPPAPPAPRASRVSRVSRDRLSAHARPDLSTSDGAAIPLAERQTQVHGMPFFEGVEARWPRGAHEATVAPDLATAAGTVQHGGTQGWAVPTDEPSSGRQDES